MRVILFVAVVLVLMGLLGWIQFHRTPEHATVTVETQTMEKDLRKTAEVVWEKTTETWNELRTPDRSTPDSPRPE